MGRKRRHSRHPKRSGGALTSLRGGFRSTVHSVTGSGSGSKSSRPTSTFRRVLSNVITVALLLVTVALLLRRFGVIHR
jgi:hypothetical protein